MGRTGAGPHPQRLTSHGERSRNTVSADEAIAIAQNTKKPTV